MSELAREPNEDSDSESSASSSRASPATTSASCSISGSSSNSSNSISTATANRDSHATTTTTTTTTSSSSSDHQTNGLSLRPGGGQSPPTATTSGAGAAAVHETEESKTQNRSDEVIQESQQRTGQKCDTAKAATTPSNLKTSCPSSPRFDFSTRQAQVERQNLEDSHHQVPSTSHSVDDSFSDMHQSMRRVTMRPGLSSSIAIDTNNNKNSHLSAKNESLSGLRRNNFSKSASGSRLVNRTDPRQARVCDCLVQNCGEKEHSNRRQFIENYYHSRTRLPTTNAMSSLNISTPLNRLSECDAITKRLMSSPIRTVNFTEKPARRVQVGEVDKSRRASVGTTNTITEQVSLYSSNQFNSLELGHGKVPKNGANNNESQDPQQQACYLATSSSTSIKDRAAYRDSGGDPKLKQQQQQQPGRSLSVCQDNTSLKPRFKNSGSNHSSNLYRAVSLACESGSSRRLLTIIPLFGCDMKALEQLMKMGLILPPPIDSAVEHILAHGINAIGIFRKSGVKSRILTLKQRIESNQDATLDEINKDNEFSIYDVADLVKMWFRELKPMPIMTKDLIKLISNYIQNQQHSDEDPFRQPHQILFVKKGMTPTLYSSYSQHGSDCLKLQIQMATSPIQRALFSRAMTFFATIASKSEANQMTSENLAICLTPSLCATESDQASIIVAQKALKYCIDNHRILF